MTTPDDTKGRELVATLVTGLHEQSVKMGNELRATYKARAEALAPAEQLLRRVMHYIEATQFLMQTDIYYDVRDYLRTLDKGDVGKDREAY